MELFSSAFVQSLARPNKSDLEVSDRKPTKHLGTVGHDYSNSLCNIISQSPAVRQYHSEPFGGSNFDVWDVERGVSLLWLSGSIFYEKLVAGYVLRQTLTWHPLFEGNTKTMVLIQLRILLP